MLARTTCLPVQHTAKISSNAAYLKHCYLHAVAVSMDTEFIQAGTLLKLDETNYLDWAKLTRGLLRSKGLWDYIDRSCPKPDAEEDKDEVKKWEKEKYKAWMVII